MVNKPLVRPFFIFFLGGICWGAGWLTSHDKKRPNITPLKRAIAVKDLGGLEDYGSDDAIR